MSEENTTQKIVVIDDRRYVINAFKGLEGWKHMPVLASIVFPMLSGMSGLFTEEGELSEDQEDQAIEKIGELLSGENSEKLTKLFVELTKGIQRDNQTIDFDREFSQNYHILFKLVFEVLKLNYYGSLQKLGTIFTPQ